MRLHEAAVSVAGDAIRRDRYLSVTVSDEELARRAVIAYKEAVPHRGRMPTERERQAEARALPAPRGMPVPAPEGVLPTEGRRP